jgi:hypothetical protein
MRIRRAATSMATAVLVSACALLPGPAGNDYDIVVANGTTLVVTVLVIGSVAHVYAAGEGGTLPALTLGRLPWSVEARTASGRLLAAMTVTDGSAGCTDEPGGGDVRACRGVVAMLDLSCGRFDMYTNGSGFTGGPAPGPGTPGDCEP